MDLFDTIIITFGTFVMMYCVVWTYLEGSYIPSLIICAVLSAFVTLIIMRCFIESYVEKAMGSYDI